MLFVRLLQVAVVVRVVLVRIIVLDSLSHVQSFLLHHPTKLHSTTRNTPHFPHHQQRQQRSATTSRTISTTTNNTNKKKRKRKSYSSPSPQQPSQTKATTTTIFQKLQSCHSPHTIIQLAATELHHDLYTTSTSGTHHKLSTVMLIRLSKLLISRTNSLYYNNNNSSRNSTINDEGERNLFQSLWIDDDGIHEDVEKEDNEDTQLFSNNSTLFRKTLQTICQTFAQGISTTLQSSLLQSTFKSTSATSKSTTAVHSVLSYEDIVEGTKAAAILYRLLTLDYADDSLDCYGGNGDDDHFTIFDCIPLAYYSYDPSSFNCEGVDRNYDMNDGMNDGMNDRMDRMTLMMNKMEPHHISGLKWAFDCFVLTDDNDEISKPRRRMITIPYPLQKRYKELNFPFHVHPGFLKLHDCHNDENGPNIPIKTPPLEQQQQQEEWWKGTTILNELTRQVDFQSEKISTTSNVVVKERRETAWQGESYIRGFAYSGKVMETKPFAPIVNHIRNELHSKTGIYYDCCLLNLYPNGNSGMRYHIDPDQGTLWENETAVVSIGASRRFAFREIKSQKEEPNNNEESSSSSSSDNNNNNTTHQNSSSSQPHTFVVMQGDVTEMFSDCQIRYQHAVKPAFHNKECAMRSSLVFKKQLSTEEEMQ